MMKNSNTFDRADDFANNLLLFERIETLLKLHLQSTPSDTRVIHELATCQRKQGKLKESIKHYRNLKTLHPKNLNYAFILDALSGNLKESQPADAHSPHPSPIIQQPDFLPPHLIQELLNHIISHQANFRPAGLMVMGKGEETGYEKSIRNNTELSLKNHPIKQLFRQRISKQLTTIYQGLGLEAFEIGKIEVQLRAYHKGEYFRTHHDFAMGRRINFVYFFHPEPKRYQGGELVIFDTNPIKMEYNHEFTRILPKNNQIVFFPSQYFHAVLPAIPQDDDFLSGRFVINGHIRMK